MIPLLAMRPLPWSGVWRAVYPHLLLGPSPWFLLFPYLPVAGKQFLSWSRPTESYFPTYVWANKSFIWVEECQWLLFRRFPLVQLSKQGLPQAIRIHLQIFGSGLYPDMANLSYHKWKALFFFVFPNLAQRESFLLFSVSLFFLLISFILINIWMSFTITDISRCWDIQQCEATDVASLCFCVLF